MNLKSRIQRLQSRQEINVESLTAEQKQRLHELEQLAINNSDPPGYDVLEHIGLYVLSRPGLTFEQYLRESEGIRL